MLYTNFENPVTTTQLENWNQSLLSQHFSGASATAFFEFLAVAAWAWIIPSHLRNYPGERGLWTATRLLITASLALQFKCIIGGFFFH